MIQTQNYDHIIKALSPPIQKKIGKMNSKKKKDRLSLTSKKPKKKLKDESLSRTP